MKTKKEQHKNVFLRMSVAKYIANDFRHIYGKDAPKITATYIEELDKHITARPLGYITAFVLRHVNELLGGENLAIYFDDTTASLKLKQINQIQNNVQE